MTTPAPRLVAGRNRLAAALALAAIASLIVLMSRWVGADSEPVTFEAFETLMISLPRPLAWLAAAAGFGWPVRRLLARECSQPVALQTALGIATLLIIDAAGAALGILTQPIAAWALIGIGAALLIVQVARRGHLSIDQMLPDAVACGSAPAVAVLLIAACSAPGWLWSSEFGGYDALSYHLQLPKEWLARGRMEPLEHNVYSWLPGYVEAAYLHLMSLRGRNGAMHALVDCQLLHATMAIVGAAMTGVVARRIAGRTAGAVAAALSLATPWSIVVGSLAYNEMVVNIMLAAGLLIALDERLSAWRRGMLIGIITAAAVGAKLTSLGFVAVPLGLVMLIQMRPRAWPGAFAGAAIMGMIGLLPYLLRNLVHGGNPLFPFATEVIGSAHWTAGQAHIWQRGHMPDATMSQRLLALWRQFFTYGMGANPRPGEPWQMQWSIVPLLGVVGGIAAALRASHRGSAVAIGLVLTAQILFWLMLTHLQSRFLLPTLVPLCVLVACGLTAVLADRGDQSESGRGWSPVRSLLALGCLALALVPVRLYHGEHPELGHAPALAIGSVLQQTGDALSPMDRVDLGTESLPAVAVNWLLPPDSKVLLVGESAPLYYRIDRIVYNTVWDRGALSQVMREHGGDPEAMRQALREMGFTHVLVNPTMLSIWQRDGWNDPLITRRSVIDFLEAAAEPLFDYARPSETTIYALPP